LATERAEGEALATGGGAGRTASEAGMPVEAVPGGPADRETEPGAAAVLLVLDRAAVAEVLVAVEVGAAEVDGVGERLGPM